MDSHTYRSTLITVGSMLFAIFFGAGNMIFPAFLGQQSGEAVFVAMAGFFITGAGLPLLGIVAMGISGEENLRSLASRVHPWFGVVFALLLYLTIGPFFALPRTATVAFEIGIVPLTKNAGMSESTLLILFSILFFALSMFLSLRPGRIVDLIGKYLTPMLLFTIFILVGYAIIQPMGALQPPTEAYQKVPVIKGLLEGYGTMDGLGALVFGTIVLNAVKSKVGEKGRVMRLTALSGLVAVSGLALVYALIAYMGATSVAELGHLENGAQVLAQSAFFYFDIYGNALLACIIILACLTTSIGLITACSTFFTWLIPALSYQAWVICFSVFACVVANYGLTAIITYSVPVLVLLYPLTIALVLLTLLNDLYGGQRIVYTTTIAFILPFAILDGVNALVGLNQAILDTLTRLLPFYAIGLGWIVPTIIGFIVGIALSKRYLMSPQPN